MKTSVSKEKFGCPLTKSRDTVPDPDPVFKKDPYPQHFLNGYFWNDEANKK